MELSFKSCWDHFKHPFTIQNSDREIKTWEKWASGAGFLLTPFLVIPGFLAFYGLAYYFKTREVKELSDPSPEIEKIRHETLPGSSSSSVDEEKGKEPIEEPAQELPLAAEGITKVRMDDQEIIQALKNQGYLEPEEKGADGRCLFRSIAPQISQEDFSQYPDEEIDWASLSANGQADLLRRMAMEMEEEFFDRISDRPKELSDEDWDWIHELYKDMQQELENPQNSILRQRFKTASDQEKLEFCLSNFNDYKRRTSRPRNFAGTSELIALSYAFNRPVRAFGQDHASSKKVACDAEGNVLPYYERLKGNGEPIEVFQCWGGGHYKYLPKNSKHTDSL